MISKTAVRSQRHRIEPELRVASSVSHMNVWWLPIFQTIEEEAVATDSEQYGHGISLLSRVWLFQNQNQSQLLCRVVGPLQMAATDGVSRQPMPRMRHAHGRGVRRAFSTSEFVVLVSLGLKAPGSRSVAS